MARIPDNEIERLKKEVNRPGERRRLQNLSR